ncbi:hypothetical protein FH972_012054 [Carpinus fangiana]|uniref:Enhancer of mRNA-decapping protein 4 C-terminal domain-containing protein n=1 Tax=Carpinus fangiana TaxID=176857 RepID=A0A5N6R2N2_9ROSI|nr:hypothetical protein FH972_012054 [Carpinus fangiana]
MQGSIFVATRAPTLGGHHNSILTQVDLRWILSLNPCPLSQVVLLHLLRQLTYGLNNNIPLKFGWMTDIANAIIPSHPMIASQVRPIFSEVCTLLNHQQYFPTIVGAELSSIRHLMHVICSKIT